MPELRYTVIEHDPDEPWIIIGETRHLTIELPDIRDFAAWAAECWPREQYTAELEPGQEEQRLKY
jgi:hypothetical protein